MGYTVIESLRGIPLLLCLTQFSFVVTHAIETEMQRNQLMIPHFQGLKSGIVLKTISFVSYLSIILYHTGRVPRTY